MALPYPTGGDWLQWAQRLVHYMNSQAANRQPTDARPLQLATLDAAVDKATQDGVLMWNPVTEKLAYSKNGAWVDVP